jgi:CheY-like chemotaxis protein
MSKRILIVDDDIDFLENMRIVISSAGYDVLTAENPSQARAKLATHTIDLLVLDVMMEKDSDGFNLAQSLKADPQYQHIPIIMATAVNQKQDAFTFGKDTDGDFLPVEKFMEKPISPDQLLAAITELSN